MLSRAKKKTSSKKKKKVLKAKIKVVPNKRPKLKKRTTASGLGSLPIRDILTGAKANLLSINYDVWISGTKLEIDKKQCINTISITETVEGADSATIEIQDPQFAYIEDNIFLEDNKIKIQMWWSGTTYKVTFNGYISVIDISFNDDGIPKLTLTCMDNTHKMNRSKKDKTFKKTTSAAVVKKIVKNHGFKCVVEAGYKFKKQETITQSHQSDIEFITKLAGDEVHPFTARLVDKTFYYVRMGHLTTPKLTLTYRSYPNDLVSFSPRINKEEIQKEIKSASINTKNKKVSSSTGRTSSSDKGGSSSKSKSNGSSKKTNSKKSMTYDPQTKKWNPTKAK